MSRLADPRMVPRPGRRSTAVAMLLIATLALLPAAGCASNKISLRSVPKSPLIDELDLTSYSGPKPSKRTAQLLRVYNLSEDLTGDIRPLLKKLQAISELEPEADTAYALAELAFLGAKRTEVHDKRASLDLYGASVLHAYDYLFDERFAAGRNPYDPHYRGACELYNAALESALRIVFADKELTPGTKKTINTASGQWDIKCKLRGTRWRPEDFERFEFVSDWEVKGLKNLYLTHGLGVPLIAVRHSYEGEPVATQYYPAGLSFPVTAFLRPLSKIDPETGQVAARNQCVLELYDPLSRDETSVAGRRVPLESDLTTPLAYFLSNPDMNLDTATAGLMDPATLLKKPADALLKKQPSRPVEGLYMVQPYEPGKIPVLMVHGLWSSPMTWMEMFNDLRSQPEIRDRYQFWFYLYPTGQPFWLSAAQLRRDLIQMRETLDPRHEEPALDQMVLIGHSMGGLVSRLQTVPSGDNFWHLVSQEPLTQIKADAKVQQNLQDTFFFQPSPSIRRVVTIATPHRGSKFSSQTTQWLLDKLIDLPNMLIPQKLFLDNLGAFPDGSLVRVRTSIDSLSPNMPIFPVMLASPQPPWVRYHNIVGLIPKEWWLPTFVADSDGVVSVESAHVDYAVSEITVPANHTTVHAHPAAVLEVRRILLEHLADLEGRTVDSVAQRPAISVPVALRARR
jgi:pimeloyl-ACP methyl ester carboxylesterase